MDITGTQHHAEANGQCSSLSLMLSWKCTIMILNDKEAGMSTHYSNHMLTEYRLTAQSVRLSLDFLLYWLLVGLWRTMQSLPFSLR